MVADYLTRLAGSEVTIETPLQLSSAKIGAAESWLRRQAIAYNRGALVSGRFTLAQLLAGGEDSSPAEGAPAPRRAGGEPATAGPDIGIDIEARSSLPDAGDFRTHPFYVDNFTAREIAHCLERRDPKESLCGLWAAKEAIRKLGGAPGIVTSLKALEIVHDHAGCPGFPGVALSISHAGELAVAVACRAPAVQASPPGAPSLGLGVAALALSLLALAAAILAIFR
jgi:phosphopantetheinyl transferase (holo-ACP synthase)